MYQRRCASRGRGEAGAPRAPARGRRRAPRGSCRARARRTHERRLGAGSPKRRAKLLGELDEEVRMAAPGGLGPSLLFQHVPRRVAGTISSSLNRRRPPAGRGCCRRGARASRCRRRRSLRRPRARSSPANTDSCENRPALLRARPARSSSRSSRAACAAARERRARVRSTSRGGREAARAGPRGVSSFIRAAASSSASGSPSTAAQIAATASAFSVVTSKSGRTARARATRSATASFWTSAAGSGCLRPGRQLERKDRVLVLRSEAERRAARREHLHRGSGGEQLSERGEPRPARARSCPRRSGPRGRGVPP